MAINETIVTGRKFRKLANAATKQWQRLSFWHKASDCEFNDGKNAETKLGAVDGITDSLASTSSRIAASAKAVNSLNNNLNSRPQFIYDSSGKITGYKTKAGADTVFPFSVEYRILKSASGKDNSIATCSIVVPNNIDKGIVIYGSTGWQGCQSSSISGNGIQSSKNLGTLECPGTNTVSLIFLDCVLNKNETITCTTSRYTGTGAPVCFIVLLG